MDPSQKLTRKKNKCLTNTVPFGRYKPCAATDKFGEKQERKLKALELNKIYGTLRSSVARYEIVDFLGEGTYGWVMKCSVQGTRKKVAVKASKTRFGVRQFMRERNILRQFEEDDSDKFHIVRLLDSFTINCQGFLAFELLDQSLYDILDVPLPLPSTLYIMSQVLSALAKLKELRIIHTDLKPENIVLVDKKKKPLFVKLIDFNSALQLPQAHLPELVQPLFYRAPEVILGLPYDEKIDIWSAGCVFVEIFTGSNLYPALTEYAAMKYICDSNGMPPDEMLNCSRYTKRYFRKETITAGKTRRCLRRKKSTADNTKGVVKRWKLKSPDEFEKETREKFYETRRYPITDLCEIFQVHASSLDDSEHFSLKEHTIDQCAVLLKKMLAVDPKDRISAKSALNSAIISEFRELPEDVKKTTFDLLRNMKLED